MTVSKMASNNYVPRVTQLDALQLDEEVIEILKNQLIDSTKFFSPTILTPIGPELEFFLRSIVFNYSMFKNAKTFGQQMLSLKYDDTYVSKGKLYWFFGYTILLKYVKDRLFHSYTSNKMAQSFISKVEKFQVIGEFLNTIRFLQTGRNCTLVDYILNLEMSSEKAFRNQYTDYAWTRELLWNSFIEVFGVLVPLLHSNTVKRLIKDKLLSTFKRIKVSDQMAFLNTAPIVHANTKCAECGGNPILPHYMGCDHIFCHYCLQAHKLNNPNYKCPKCDFYSTMIKRVPSG